MSSGVQVSWLQQVNEATTLTPLRRATLQSWPTRKAFTDCLSELSGRVDVAASKLIDAFRVYMREACTSAIERLYPRIQRAQGRVWEEMRSLVKETVDQGLVPRLVAALELFYQRYDVTNEFETVIEVDRLDGDTPVTAKVALRLRGELPCVDESILLSENRVVVPVPRSDRLEDAVREVRYLNWQRQHYEDIYVAWGSWRIHYTACSYPLEAVRGKGLADPEAVLKAILTVAEKLETKIRDSCWKAPPA